MTKFRRLDMLGACFLYGFFIPIVISYISNNTLFTYFVQIFYAFFGKILMNVPNDIIRNGILFPKLLMHCIYIQNYFCMGVQIYEL